MRNVDLEYRGRMGQQLYISIPDPHSIRIEQSHYDRLMEATSEHLVKYLEEVDLEVLTLDLANSLKAREKLSEALKQIEDDDSWQ